LSYKIETGKIAFAGFFSKYFAGLIPHLHDQKNAGLRDYSRKILREIPSRAGLYYIIFFNFWVHKESKN
jgi:hypothetical protein